MRKEIYKAIGERLLAIGADGQVTVPAGEPAGTVAAGGDERDRLIKYVDLWNHNVEFLDQEQPWERPAVFVEFAPIVWDVVKPGREYRCKGQVLLHVVTDWQGDASCASELQEAGLEVLDYSAVIHGALQGLEGEAFSRMELLETHTNHNHEDLVESIEVYRFVGERRLDGRGSPAGKPQATLAAGGDGSAA